MDAEIYKEMKHIKEENQLLKKRLNISLDLNKELQFDKMRLDVMLSLSPIALWSVNKDGIFTSCEGLDLEILGLKPGQVVGLSLFDIFKDFPEIITAHKNTLEGSESSYEFEMDGIPDIENGTRLKGIVYDAKTMPIINERGDVDGLIFAACNITSLKNIERNLIQKANYQDALTEISNIVIASTNLDELFRYCVETVSTRMNIEFSKILHLQKDGEVLKLLAGVGWKDGLVGTATVNAKDKSQAGYTLLSSKPVIVEYLKREKRFSAPELLLDHNINSGISVIIGEAGSPWGIFAVHSKVERNFSENDISLIQSVANLLFMGIEREKSRKKSKDNQRLYQDLYNNAPDMYVSVDAKTRIVVNCNKTLAKTLGYSKKDIIGYPVFNIYHPSSINAAIMAFQKFKDTGRVLNEELILKKKDGGQIDVSLNVSSVRNEKGEIIFTRSALRDITESKIIRSQLFIQSQYLKRINLMLESYKKCLTTVLHAVDEISLKREICELLVEISKYYMVWIGLAVNDEKKSVLPIVFAGKEEEYLKNIIIRWDDSKFAMGPVGMAIKTKQTQIVPNYETDPNFKPWIGIAHERGYKGSISIPMIIEENNIETLNLYLPEADQFNEEELSLLEGIAENLTFGIKSLRTKLALNQTLKDLDQKVNDRTIELQLKNQELSEFTFSVTHDLRAPLRAMQGFSDALLEDYRDVLDNTAIEMAHRINRAAEKMDTMIKDLLIHSKVIQSDIRLTHLDLEQCINDAIDENIDIITQNTIDLNVDIPAKEIKGSKVIVKQIINNLVSNAIKFSDGKKSPRIKIWSEPKENMIRLYVEDNGIGIEKQYFEKIFNVFERLNSEDQYPGTGIGLAIVKKGVERMRGRYGVESNVGEFSRFWIELPV